MKIVFAKEYGFCYGVKRAVELADQASTLAGDTYTLGNLIHNPRVVADLAAKGVANVDDIQDAPDGANVIIRSHGTSASVYDLAASKGCNVVDATCPNVRRAQKTAAEFQQAGKKVLIIGDALHPEVQSIASWAVEPIVFEDIAVVPTLPVDQEYGILCQTTLEQSKFKDIVQAIQDRGLRYEVKPTICLATKHRQDAAVALAREVDAMLVIGGFKSANTGHLYELVKDICPAWHIEGPEGITAEMLKGVNTLGITAGASTPEWLIQEVVDKINSF